MAVVFIVFACVAAVWAHFRVADAEERIQALEDRDSKGGGLWS